MCASCSGGSQWQGQGERVKGGVTEAGGAAGVGEVAGQQGLASSF